MITGLSQHGVDERAPPTQDAKRACVALKAADHGTLERREGHHIYPTANPYQTPHIGLVFTTTYTSYAGGKPPQRLTIISLFSPPIVAAASAGVLAGDLSKAFLSYLF
jgi:hypothetical protein